MSDNCQVNRGDLQTVLNFVSEAGVAFGDRMTPEQRDEFMAAFGRVMVSAFQEETKGGWYRGHGQNKITVIKAVRALRGWDLREAKAWVESPPHAITASEAEELMRAGANVTAR